MHTVFFTLLVVALVAPLIHALTPESLMSVIEILEASNPNATVDWARQPAFSTAGDWVDYDCATHQDAPDQDSAFHWSQAGSMDALIQLVAGWNTCIRNSSCFGPQYNVLSSFTWESFHMGQGGGHDCSSTKAPDLCMPPTCENMHLSPKPLAAIHIARSFSRFAQVIASQIDTFETTIAGVTSGIYGFVNKFASIPDTSKQDAISDAVFDILTSAISMGVSSGFSAIFKTVKFAKYEDIGEQFGELVTSGLDMGWDALKDTMKRPNNTADIAGSLNTLLASYRDAVTDTQRRFLENVMVANGTVHQQALFGLLDRGAMLGYSRNADEDLADMERSFTQHTQALVYGSILPVAWALSVKEFRPFILRVDKNDYKCGDPVTDWNTCPYNKFCLGRYMSPAVAANSSWCDPEGNSWYLVSARKHWCTDRFRTGPCDSRGNPVGGYDGLPFQPLDGGDINTLNGVDYGGIALKDIIISSYTGFLQNNKENNYSMPAQSTDYAEDDFTITKGASGLPYSGGVRTPGFFNFDICFNAELAAANGRIGGSPSDDPHVICGIKPDVGTFVSDPGSGSFAPGWCGIHVIQYQKNEGDLNPLGEFQIQVTIKDNGQQIIGEATKQPGGEPLVIVNSALPYNLIVDANGPYDDSPVSFWYSDAFWDSNDQGHHCNFGGYDSGKREGDCGFTCALPNGGPPPVSATVDHPLPGAPTDAIAGPNKYVNTYATAPTAAPPPPPPPGPPPPAPTPTYASGWCGLHVRQYQRREADSNPTDDYQVEVILQDAQKNFIGASGKVPALADQGLNVQGSLLQPLVVTTSDGDDYPIRFDFGDQHWDSNSGQCSVGGYDHGARDMDCGFTC